MTCPAETTGDDHRPEAFRFAYVEQATRSRPDDHVVEAVRRRVPGGQNENHGTDALAGADPHRPADRDESGQFEGEHVADADAADEDRVCDRQHRPDDRDHQEGQRNTPASRTCHEHCVGGRLAHLIPECETEDQSDQGSNDPPFACLNGKNSCFHCNIPSWSVIVTAGATLPAGPSARRGRIRKCSFFGKLLFTSRLWSVAARPCG